MGRAETIAALSTELASVAQRIRPTTLAGERTLPVVEPLEPLLPDGGLRRGSTVAVDGPAATSLALALAVAASQDGAWVAAVGCSSLGLAAAAELGLALDRFVLVADPPAAAWAQVTAALVDAFGLVVVRADGPVRLGDARRLVARVRERSGVLVQVGSGSWPEGADVGLRVVAARWEGLGDGHGHLRARQIEVESGGRRAAARPRRVALWLPAFDGGVDTVVPAPVPLRTAGRR